MKFDIKKIVLWLIVVMIMAFVIAGVTISTKGVDRTLNLFNGNGDSSANLTKYDINVEKSFSSEGVKELYASTVSNNIHIIPSDTEEIRVHYYGEYYTNSEASIPELYTDSSNGKVIAEVKHKPSVGINFNSSRGTLRMDIFIPKKYSKNIELRTTSGDADISEMQIEKLVFNSVSGSLKTDAVLPKETDISTTSGKVDLNEFSGSIKFKSVSGDLNAVYSSTANVVSEKISSSINTTSGRANLKNFYGELICKTISGRYEVDYVKFDNNFEARSTSGSVRLRMPADSQFNINYNSTSGDFKSDFAMLTTSTNRRGTEFEGKVGNSGNDININTTSGDVMIEKK